MRRPFALYIFLFAVLLYTAHASAVAVRVGPMFNDGNGEETEVRLASVSVSTLQWSLKDGCKDAEATSVTLMILRQAPDIIGLNLEKSEVKSFTDDKGTDLLGGSAKNDESKPGLDATPPSGYAQNLNVRIWGPHLPHSDAKTLRAEGKLTLIVGMNRMTVENRDVPIKEGSEINAGPYMLKITKVGPVDAKKHPWVQNHAAIAMTIEGESNRRLVRDLQFTDKNGNYINISMAGATYGKENGKDVYEYIVLTDIDKVTAKVSYWAGAEEITLPFKFETGLDGEAHDIK